MVLYGVKIIAGNEGFRVSIRALAKRKVRSIIEELETSYSSVASKFPFKRVEEARVDGLRAVIYIVDGMPCFFQLDGKYYPTIQCLARFKEIPLKGRIFVDKGATIALAKGAHLMLPGITRVEGEFGEGDVVACFYDKTGAPVMVGVAELDSEAMKRLSEAKAKGRAVRRIHYVGDKIWEAVRLLELGR